MILGIIHMIPFSSSDITLILVLYLFIGYLLSMLHICIDLLLILLVGEESDLCLRQGKRIKGS